MQTTEKKIQHLALATEKLGSVVDSFRVWMTQAWKISLLMTKGAYLLSERKALYTKLGEHTYYKIKKGEWSNAELESEIIAIDKLNKKIELEEIQIRSTRYGKKATSSFEEDELI